MVSLKDLRKKEQGDRGLTILHQAGRCRAEQSRAEQSRVEQCLVGRSQAEQSRVEHCQAGRSQAEQSREEHCQAGRSQAEQSREEHCLIKPCQVKPLLGEYCLIGFLLARIIHKGSLRKRADAKRDRHSEAGDWLCHLTSPSSVEPRQYLSRSADQAPRRMAPAPNSMSKG
jgi:hypothetical protein